MACEGRGAACLCRRVAALRRDALTAVRVGPGIGAALPGSRRGLGARECRPCCHASESARAGGWSRVVRTRGEEGLGEGPGPWGGGQGRGSLRTGRVRVVLGGGAQPGLDMAGRGGGWGPCPLRSARCVLVGRPWGPCARGGRVGSPEGPSPCHRHPLSSGPSWTEGARSGWGCGRREWFTLPSLSP